MMYKVEYRSNDRNKEDDNQGGRRQKMSKPIMMKHSTLTIHTANELEEIKGNESPTITVQITNNQSLKYSYTQPRS